MRVGEVRLSSIVVYPEGPFQLCQISVADVAIYLSNSRYNHNFENSRLSCSKLVMNISQVRKKGLIRLEKERLSSSIEDALQKMDFILVTTLDCLDASISLKNLGYVKIMKGVRRQKESNDANVTLTLSIGLTSMYTCQDSFLSFTNTLNELILKLTLPSSKEIELIKKETLSSQHNRIHKLNTAKRNGESNGEEISEMKDYEQNPSFLLNETVDDDIFFIKENTIRDPDCQHILKDNFSKSLCTRSNNILKKIPDSELTASQLRKKYDVKNAYNFSDIHSKDEDFRTNGIVCKQSNNHDFASNKQEGWTIVDYQWSHKTTIPKTDDQSSKWYAIEERKQGNLNTITKTTVLSDKATIIVEGNKKRDSYQIFPLHIPINPSPNPLLEGDMDSTRFAGTKTAPKVNFRILIKGMSLCWRFFDGYDWSLPSCSSVFQNKIPKSRVQLLEGLLEETALIEEKVMPETVSKILKPRQVSCYFSFSFTGLKLRKDFFEQAPEHRISSCMDLVVADIFLSESINEDPIKVIGEWANEYLHPRDTNDGQLMLKVSF